MTVQLKRQASTSKPKTCRFNKLKAYIPLCASSAYHKTLRHMLPRKRQPVMARLVLLFVALSVVSNQAVMLTAQQKPQKLCRRFWIQNSCTASAVLLTGLPSHALVKGNAPPQKTSRSSGRKCRDIDECEALGQLREQESFQAAQEPFETTPDGVRYRDVRPALW